MIRGLYSPKLIGALLVLALAFFAKPYAGIRHDSVLYFGQSMLYMAPENFSRDIFFAFGSQAQYTFFPQIIAALLQWFSPSELFLALTIFGKLFFVVTAYLLIRELIPDGFRFYAILCVVLMPGVYGGHHMLSYSESFLTGRTFAEPFALLSIWSLLRSYWMAATVFGLISAFIHPLIALPILAIIAVALTVKNRNWLWLASGALLVTFTGFIFSDRIDFLFARYDADWMEQTLKYNPLGFVTTWTSQDYATIMFDYWVLILAVKNLAPLQGNWFRILIYSSAMLLTLSIILADLGHLSFFSGMQLWRTLWLVHLLSMMVLPFLLFCIFRQTGNTSLKLLLLILAFVISVSSQAIQYSAVVVGGLILIFWLWDRVHNSISPLITRIFKAALVLALLIQTIKFFVTQISTFIVSDVGISGFRLDSILLSHPLVASTLIPYLLYLWRTRESLRPVAILFTVVFFIYAFYSFDSRSPWNRLIESKIGSSDIFGVKIPPNAQIYWENELLPTWLMLGRASYFSRLQASGLLFNRGTAMEYKRRDELFENIEMQLELCGIIDAFETGGAGCAPALDSLQEACAAIESSVPVYFVFDGQVIGASPQGVWKANFSEARSLDSTFYLYSCADFEGRPL